MNEINTVIIGSLHHNTLGVIRSLGEAGIPQNNISIMLVGEDHSPRNLISTSKYVNPERIIYVNSYDEIIPCLQNNNEFYEKRQRVVICCSDGASGAVIAGKELLKDKFKTPETYLDVADLMVKSYQGIIAKESGLTVPYSKEFITNSPIEWNIFPCILKPYKCATGAGKSDIHVLYSREDLDVIIKQIKSERIQIQQYVEKDIEFQLIGCSLDAGKKLIIPGFTKIIRQPKTTNTGYLLYSPIKELSYDSDSVKRFVQRIGYSGLFSIEFVRGKDGIDYFLEINLRNDGNAYCVNSAGVNLPYIWSYYQVFRELPPKPTSISKAVYFIPDFNDLRLAIHEIGLLRWIKQFREAQSHSIYNKKDMRPFWFEFRRQCKRVLRKETKL